MAETPAGPSNQAAPYSSAIYDAWGDASARSARAVLGVLWDFYRPASVVDVGCGIGTWLAAAETLGARTLTGLDGPWVNRAQLRSAAITFTPVDFEAEIPDVGRHDLAMSVEVAEHVSERRADAFVAGLTRLSDVVVFGAAIPDQGGVSHVNERWPSWWAAKFADAGFEPFDVLRAAVWQNAGVEWWYRQNILLYVRRGATGIDRDALKARERSALDLVHPALYEAKVAEIRRVHERPDGRFLWQTLRRYLFPPKRTR